jgi:hypothetical protein
MRRDNLWSQGIKALHTGEEWSHGKKAGKQDLALIEHMGWRGWRGLASWAALPVDRTYTALRAEQGGSFDFDFDFDFDANANLIGREIRTPLYPRTPIRE